MRTSPPAERASKRVAAEPGTRIMSPKVARITSGLPARAIA